MVEKLWTVDCSQRVLSTLNELLESSVCPQKHDSTQLWGFSVNVRRGPGSFLSTWTGVLPS